MLDDDDTLPESGMTDEGEAMNSGRGGGSRDRGGGGRAPLNPRPDERAPDPRSTVADEEDPVSPPPPNSAVKADDRPVHSR